MARLLKCSFCGKSEQEVRKLAAGPGGLHICDGCVDVCQIIMSGEEALPRRFDPDAWPTERLLDALAPLERTVETSRAHLGAVVDALRAREVSWARIAKPLGISRQAAWERFS